MDDHDNPETDIDPRRRTTLKAAAGLSAAAAGLGTADTAAAHDGSHTITITARGETAHYEFAVDGDVTKADANEATINPFDTIEDDIVFGRTTREPDAYEFDGLITEFSTTEPVAVFVDGTRIDLASSSEGVDERADVDTGDDETEDASEDEAEAEDDEPESPPQEQQIDESDYSEVVNIVEAGADNSGGSSIHGVLNSVLDSGVLAKFPAGTYRMSGGVRIVNEGRIGMLAEGDVTIVHDHGNGVLCKLGTYKDPNEVVEVEGFTVDLSQNNTGGRAFECHATDSLYVGDVTIDGQHDTSGKGPLAVGLQSPSGEGLVENYEAPDGGEDVSGGYGGTGLLISNYHEGTVTVRDAHIGAFPDNGIYCSNGTPPSHQGGTVHVEGGLVENTNVAGVRLAGHGSSIDGTKFVYDDDISGFGGQRPIRVDWGTDLSIRNVEIDMSISITEAIRVLDGVDSLTIEGVSGDLSSSVRDVVSIGDGAGSVETSNIAVSGQSRYQVFEY